jgi:hypothetical protein
VRGICIFLSMVYGQKKAFLKRLSLMRFCNNPICVRLHNRTEDVIPINHYLVGLEMLRFDSNQ